jgi:hypothetical protein
MSDEGFVVGGVAESIEEENDRWMQEYMTGGADRCEECIRRGMSREAVEKGREVRRRWDAEQYADAECAPLVEGPLPGAALPGAAVVASPGAEAVLSGPAAKDASGLSSRPGAEVGAAKASPPTAGVPSPPTSIRREFVAKPAEAEPFDLGAALAAAVAAKQEESPPFCAGIQPSIEAEDGEQAEDAEAGEDYSGFGCGGARRRLSSRTKGLKTKARLRTRAAGGLERDLPGRRGARPVGCRCCRMRRRVTQRRHMRGGIVGRRTG